jgi:hypothetical protein
MDNVVGAKRKLLEMIVLDPAGTIVIALLHSKYRACPPTTIPTEEESVMDSWHSGL